MIGAAPLAATRAHADETRDDYRHERDGFRDAQTRNYVTLAAMDIGRRDTVDIDRNLGRFRSLRVMAIRGAGYIDFIEVRYANGEQQHIDVKRTIGRGEVADIDLNGAHRLEAITVHGTPDGHSAIQVIGLR
ncbi:MAG: hypothetical protein JO257_05210 [Deltaproteobacteria bacterium]|nr:hypothetical protein [Deltaproteobacteria bacterium]